ncbi:hypothetical protein C8R44DRAFT_742351 [Mycena epipterygia]|nr:hypothetical protein C8R44DRAFT_742351 [Mycena epipterygia]
MPGHTSGSRMPHPLAHMPWIRPTRGMEQMRCGEMRGEIKVWDKRKQMRRDESGGYGIGLRAAPETRPKILAFLRKSTPGAGDAGRGAICAGKAHEVSGRRKRRGGERREAIPRIGSGTHTCRRLTNQIRQGGVGASTGWYKNQYIGKENAKKLTSTTLP